MRVLITGAAGLVGSNIVVKCAASGIEALAHDKINPSAEVREHVGSSAAITWIRGDLYDWAHLLEIALQYEIEGVIHSAALPNVSSCRPAPLTATRVNVVATQNLLELARRLKWRRVVYVSTGAVFQRSNDPDSWIHDDDPPCPNDVYGTTKYMGELLANMYYHVYDVDTCTVRASWVWGPPERPLEQFDLARGPISLFVKAAMRNESLHVPGGGDFRANLTYVKDLANAIVLAYRKDELKQRVFNVSNGAHYSVSDVATAVKKVVPNADISVGSGLEPWTEMHATRGSFDIGGAKAELGYTVDYFLEEGLRDYTEWLRRVRY